MFDRIGKRMVCFYLIAHLALMLLSGAVALPLFRFVSGDSLNIVYTDLREMVLGWLPTNLVNPLVDCNAMQLGLPAEALTPMLATDIFFDAVCTAFNQVSVQMALLQQAGSMDLLDLETLRQAKS